MKLGLLLLSGCCKVPYGNLYWADAPSIHNEARSCAMSRNRFREILSNLHLADNTQTTKEIYNKVLVLLEMLNFNFKQYGSFVSHSVDESIIPYYEKHGRKQFIRGKAIRFGFKLWYITSSEHLLHAEPYCRVDTDLPDTSLGQEPDVLWWV